MCIAVSAMAITLLLAGLLGSWSPSTGLTLLYVAPLLGAGTILFFGLFLGPLSVGDDARTARLIRSRMPQLGADVLSAVELRATPDDPGVSRALIDAHIARTDARVGEVDPRTIVDGRRTRRLGSSAMSIALGCALVVVAFKGHWWKGVQSALKPRAAGPSNVVAEPITGDVELTLNYPAYTGFAQRVLPGTNGDVSAPAGTRVQLKTRADRKVGRAELVLEGATVPLKVDNERDLSGEFVVQKTGSYKFRFFSSHDRQLAEGPPIPINVEADQPPKVTILTPGDEVEVDPNQKLTLKYDVTDDFGVTELQLVYRMGSNPEEKRIPLPKDEGRTTRANYAWDLQTLHLRPGDHVSYYLEAKDNDEVAGHKKGVSRTLSLKTYSAAEHRREALKAAEALWERLLTQLANRMEGPDRDRDHTIEQVASQGQVDEAGFQLVKDFDGTAHDLSKNKDSPIELWTALANIADSLGNKVQNTGTTRKLALRIAKNRPSDVDLGRRLIHVVDQEIAEEEKDVLYLEALIDRHKIQDLKEMAKELANERRELADLVEQYKKTNDPEAQKKILEQVALMKQHINELMQRMSEMVKGIRDEHFNAEAMKELMQDQEMSNSLDEIDKLLKEGKTDEALKKLQEMSMKMEEMIQNMDDAEDKVSQQVDPELAAQFQKFMDDLQKTTAEQQKLTEQTKELKDRYREKMKERIAEKGKQLKEELQKDLDKVQKDYQGLDSQQLSQRSQKSLEAAQSELENMKNALQVSDYDLAQEAGQRAQESAEDLSHAADQQAMRDEIFQNPDQQKSASKKGADRLKQDEKTLREVNEKLAQLFPNPSQVMSEQDKQKMKELSKQQRQLKGQSDQLRQQMEQLGDKAPIFDQNAESQMQQIGERMDDAAQKLEAKDASRGHGDQRAALEQLQKFQQQMQQQGSGKGGKGGLPLPMMAGGGRGGFGPNTQNEKIEIPDADQFQAPKEFRKDLLDAMKQGAPDRYKEQVKRYYEELVK
ncbi:MAG: DUF4175 family protein [Myxococcaceae bacterium]